MKINIRLISLLAAFLLFACDSNLGISAYKVDDLVANPRIHEGKEISVTGTLRSVDESLKLLGVTAKLEGTNSKNVIYLLNFAAQVNFDSKYVIKGQFATVTLPLLGSYLVIDAKSVERCGGLNLC
jgi:hypothetical protein